jgi:uncharacterized protein (DUF1499 family)
MLRWHDMSGGTVRTSRVANTAAGLAIVGVLLVAVGPLLSMTGSAAPMTGFNLFGLGGLLSLCTLLLGLVALVRTRPTTGLSGRRRAVLGTLLSAAGFAALVVAAAPGASFPPINDITTDPGDPPVFIQALSAEANRDRDMSYPGAEFEEQQRSAYPDLAPLDLPVPPRRAFDAVLVAFESEGLEVAHQDRASGHIEGFEATRIFRFVDDVVVRVRPAEGGSRIDLRSKSRDGQGDLGANGSRIRRLQDAIRSQQ